MKLNGSHKFKASSWQVFNAILNPEVLQSCMPGCNSIEYLDPTRLRANITTPLPGLKGPYDATADLQGLIAIANNPIGQGITKNSLKSFLEKLDKAIF